MSNSLLSNHFMRKDCKSVHHSFKDDEQMTINGFRSAGITEAIENAKDIVEIVENTFKEF